MSTYDIIGLISGIAMIIFVLLALNYYFDASLFGEHYLRTIICVILAILSFAVFVIAIIRRPEPTTIDEYMQEVEDTETGVHYFIKSGPNGKSSVTVRYNSDGTVYTEEKE